MTQPDTAKLEEESDYGNEEDYDMTQPDVAKLEEESDYEIEEDYDMTQPDVAKFESDNRIEEDYLDDEDEPDFAKFEQLEDDEESDYAIEEDYSDEPDYAEFEEEGEFEENEQSLMHLDNDIHAKTMQLLDEDYELEEETGSETTGNLEENLEGEIEEMSDDFEETPDYEMEEEVDVDALKDLEETLEGEVDSVARMSDQNEVISDVDAVEMVADRLSLATRYVGVGYDLVRGSPEGEFRRGGVDPGIKITRHIFGFTYTKGKMAHYFDKSMKVPDEVVFHSFSSCSATESHSAYSGSSSYRNNLASSVQVRGMSFAFFVITTVDSL